MARYLDVCLHSDLVGTLQQDDHGDLGFQYTPAWLERPNAVSLPFRCFCGLNRSAAVSANLFLPDC